MRHISESVSWRWKNHRQATQQCEGNWKPWFEEICKQLHELLSVLWATIQHSRWLRATSSSMENPIEIWSPSIWEPSARDAGRAGTGNSATFCMPSMCYVIENTKFRHIFVHGELLPPHPKSWSQLCAAQYGKYEENDWRRQRMKDGRAKQFEQVYLCALRMEGEIHGQSSEAQPWKWECGATSSFE